MSLRRFFRRAAWDRERAAEIDAHIAHMADDLRGRGLAPAEAERRARARFGNPTLVREEIYEMNSIPMFENIARDARYAVRMLRRTPGFAITAILTLAVAIGANTAVFSLVDAVLLRPLPYPQPERLANPELRWSSPRGSGAGTSIDGATWEAIARHVTSADAAVYSDWRSGANLATSGQALHVDQARVSAGYFRVLGVAPALGREFTAEEDAEGGPNAVILSHGLWQQAFGGRPDVLGSTVLVRGEGHRVVGIMPEGFRATSDVDLWTPIRPSAKGQGGGTNYQALLRLAPGATWPAVEAEIAAAVASLGRPQPANDVVRVWGVRPLQESLTEDTRDTLYTMWAAVALVLVIACVNLAGLLLARARTRAREISTRMALGSGRRAVVRQLLVESGVLAVAGGALGIVLGIVLLGALQQLAGDRYSGWQNVSLNWRGIALTAIVALASAVAFGLLPALQATRVDVQSGLREGDTRGASAAHGGWTRRVLVVAEVALGLVLLVGAGLLTRTFLSLQNLDPGFDLTDVVTASASLEDSRYETAERTVALYEQTIERIEALPGVESASVSLGLPYERILNLGFRPLDGEAVAGIAEKRNFITNATYVTPAYFETLRMPVRAGRALSMADRDGTAPVAVVNEAFQRLYYPKEGVLGRRIRMGGGDREVVGIVGDVQYRQPGWGSGGPIRTTPIVYIPAAQTPAAMMALVHTWFAPTWIVRASGPVAGIERAIRGAVAEVDPQLPLASVRSMSDVRADASAGQRFMMVLAGLLAVASMLLAAIGIHGLIASAVTERTREIGIRMALGSTASQAIRAVTVPGLVLVVVGLVIGVALARASTTYIEAMLWGVEPTDIATYALVAGVLLAVAVVASVLPALRILRLDPATTLRA